MICFDDVPIRTSTLSQQASEEKRIVIPPKPISEIPEHMENIEMKNCPYCSRNFRKDVADRHIPKC